MALNGWFDLSNSIGEGAGISTGVAVAVGVGVAAYGGAVLAAVTAPVTVPLGIWFWLGVKKDVKKREEEKAERLRAAYALGYGIFGDGANYHPEHRADADTAYRIDKRYADSHGLTMEEFGRDPESVIGMMRARMGISAPKAPEIDDRDSPERVEARRYMAELRKANGWDRPALALVK